MSALPDDRLRESIDRLEAAGVLVGVRVDDAGGMVRIVATEAAMHQAVLDGFVLYSPADVCHYIQLEPRERRMLHSFKKRFGGVVEWR